MPSWIPHLPPAFALTIHEACEWKAWIAMGQFQREKLFFPIWTSTKCFSESKINPISLWNVKSYFIINNDSLFHVSWKNPHIISIIVLFKIVWLFHNGFATRTQVSWRPPLNLSQNGKEKTRKKSGICTWPTNYKPTVPTVHKQHSAAQEYKLNK